MLPEFSDDGYLPAGIHPATQREFEDRFAVFNRSDRRFRVYEGLRRLFDEARKSGIVRRVIVGGSFVTNKPEPNDFDCILVLDISTGGRALRPFEYNLVSRKAARRMFGGDVMPAVDGSQALTEFLEFFQTTRDGQRTGIVEIQL